MKEVVEIVAAHPWASAGATALVCVVVFVTGLVVESIGVAIAAVVRAARSLDAQQKESEQ